MEIGESKTVTLPPNEAYGEIITEMVQEVPKKFVPETVTVGEMLTTETEQGSFNVVVKEVNEEFVILDGNHPMAGKTLVFELEVVEIV